MITLVSEECPTLPVIGRVGILNLIPLIEQAQESIRFIDPKNRTLANGARMRHPTLKMTRVLAFAYPSDPLALQGVAHAAISLAHEERAAIQGP